ncbi:MAG: FAD-binding protein [Muribaculaceae bacterium]|nr:FAD-binding protein [Muribaculaceae bacterium]
MQHDITLQTDPRIAGEATLLKKMLADKLSIPARDINDFRIWRRSVDARGNKVRVNLSVKVASGEDKKVSAIHIPKVFAPVPSDAPVMVIVGAGPAGLFAALKCIESGIRPIVLERGKDVDSRRLDIADISRKKRINPDSNYCYGEGGAGAFSDGKLFTRSKKRGNNEEVLQMLVQFGASEDILIDAHPHIGSDRLPKIIKRIRETIIENGGEVLFEKRAERLLLERGKAIGVVVSDGEEYRGSVMLANGHSARDFIRNLHSQGVKMEAKGLAMGVRLEHPQKLIDRIQYHQPDGRGKYLPAAEYSFVAQSEGRGVYSFCMCPGGVIVPAGSSEGELVVNGMSASARAGNYSNSGMVVELHPGDFPEYGKFNELELMQFQEDLEKKFYHLSDNSINAPAQRMTDFVEGKKSETLPATSYAPGIHSADFNKLLPSFISNRLRAGFEAFGKKRKGFLSKEAILVGLESRTSSPVRLPRDKESYEHIVIENLYPVGEGAGYAGGIVSAAIDGMNAVKAFREKLNREN